MIENHQEKIPLYKHFFENSRNSRRMYLELLGQYADEKIPYPLEMPNKLTLPDDVLTYFRLINELQENTGKEHFGYIDVTDNLRFTPVQSGDKDSCRPWKGYIRSCMRNPALVFVHAHPNGGSAPSLGDIETFRRFPQIAYIHAIVASGNVSLLLQTRQSLRLQLSSFASGLWTAAKAESILLRSAKYVHQEVEDKQTKFTRRHALDGQKFELVHRDYALNVAPILEKAGWAYYKFDGDLILNTTNEVVFNRVSAKNDMKS